MEPVEQQKKRSPWVYVGIGCGVFVLLAIVGVFLGVSFLFKKGKEYQEDMANPITRTEKVKATLGAQTLPDGYYAVMSLNVPAIMDLAVLSTSEPGAPPTGHPEGVRVFVYMFLKTAPASDQEQLRKYLEGTSEDPSVLTRYKVRMGDGEIIGRGVLPLQGRRVLYLSQRGELEAQDNKSQGPGLNSVLLIECPGQTRTYLGLWMSPDPDPGSTLEELDLKGTPADPEAIRAFMTHINPCKGS